MINHFPTQADLPRVRLSLQAFAEGGGAADGGDSGTGVGAPVPGAREGVGTKPRDGQSSTADAAEGTEAEAVEASDEEASAAETAPDYDKEFEDFCKRPEMKARMDRVKGSAVRSRMRSTEGELKNAREMMGILGERYGVDPADTKALRAALEADDRIEVERAEEAGMPLEIYREVNRLRRQAKEAENRERAVEDSRRAMAMRTEAAAVAKEFPGFDLEGELADPQFQKMLDAGVGMRSAYIAMHHRDIVNATVKRASEEAETRVAETVKVNRSRPKEGGSAGGAPAPTGVDYNAMSSADFKALCDRVKRGEYTPR